MTNSLFGYTNIFKELKEKIYQNKGDPFSKINLPYDNLGDTTTTDINHYLKKFKKLDTLPISSFRFYNDIILRVTMGDDFQNNNLLHLTENDNVRYIGLDDFEAYFHSLADKDKPKAIENIYSGETFDPYYKGKNYKIPILLFNHEYTREVQAIINNTDFEKAGIGYLIGTEDPKKQFKLGTIGHEIGHVIFNETMGIDDSLFNKFEKLIKDSDSITEYAEWYRTDENDVQRYIESFCELVRLYTTNKKFIDKYYPKWGNFIEHNFSEYIVPNN